MQEKAIYVLNDIHIYHNKLEYLIKLVIWWICWLGGIWVLQGESLGIGSAYFVFALSQLMEFAPKSIDKKYICSRVILVIFCIAITIILLMSTALLFSKEYIAQWHNAMYILSLCTLVFMSLDCVILLFSTNPDPVLSTLEITSTNKKELMDKFETSLQSGLLGNIEKKG